MNIGKMLYSNGTSKLSGKPEAVEDFSMTVLSL